MNDDFLSIKKKMVQKKRGKKEIQVIYTWYQAVVLFYHH